MKAASILFSLLLATSGFAAGPEKWQLMQKAVMIDHDLDEIRSLVASGGDPNAPIGCGTYAPLNAAVQQGNPDMVALLLSLGAKPTDTQMVEAVFASTPFCLKIVKMLLAAGASINAREYYSKTDNRFANPIHQAVWKRDRELIAFLLSQKGIELNNPNVDGNTPLMIAVEKGDEEIVDMLLAAGADPRQKNQQGLDASGVAAQVIARQEGFLGKFAQSPDPAPPRATAAR